MSLGVSSANPGPSGREAGNQDVAPCQTVAGERPRTPRRIATNTRRPSHSNGGWKATIQPHFWVAFVPGRLL